MFHVYFRNLVLNLVHMMYKYLLRYLYIDPRINLVLSFVPKVYLL